MNFRLSSTIAILIFCAYNVTNNYAANEFNSVYPSLSSGAVNSCNNELLFKLSSSALNQIFRDEFSPNNTSIKEVEFPLESDQIIFNIEDLLLHSTSALHNLSLARIHNRIFTANPDLFEKRIRELGLDRIRLQQFSTSEECRERLAQLLDNPLVEYVVIENFDSKYSNTTGDFYSNTDLMWGLEYIGAEQVWSTTTGKDVVVAVVDTGIDIDHPDLAQNIYVNPGEIANNGVDDDGNGYIDDMHGWNPSAEANDSGNADISDKDGHGTAIAGIIGALAGNGIGIAGIAPEVKLMAVKNNFSGIAWATANGADIISLATGKEKQNYSEIEWTNEIAFVDDLMRMAEYAGITAVMSTGNSARHIGTTLPPKNGFGIKVAAAQLNFGANDEIMSEGIYVVGASNYGHGTDVLAPGYHVLTTASSANHFSATDFSNLNTQEYVFFSGTSAASPHVSGIAALLKSLNPNWTPEQIRQAIRMSAGTVFYNNNEYYGTGFALAEAIEISDPPSARIRWPMTGDSISGMLEILGYTDSVRPVQNVRLWLQSSGDSKLISVLTENSTELVSDGDTLFELDTLTLDEGNYTLQLTVEDKSGLLASDAIDLRIDNLGLVAKSTSGLSSSDNLDLTVTLAIPTTSNPFQGFSIQIASSETPDSYSTILSQITFPANGSTNVKASLEGLNAGNYIVKLVATYGQFSHSETIEITVENDVLWEFTNINSAQAETKVADLNGDGLKEVIVMELGSLNIPAKLHVLDANGKELPGWPISKFFMSTRLAISDLNNDGNKEIIVAGLEGKNDPYKNLYVFTISGATLPGWPKETQAKIYDDYVLTGDLNGNGQQEVVYLANQGNDLNAFVHVYDNTGNLLSGWPKLLPIENAGPKRYSALISDTDADGKEEIYIKSGLTKATTTLWALNIDGSIRPEFPALLPAQQSCPRFNFVYEHMVSGDTNGDGINEIFVSNYRFSNTGQVTEICASNPNNGTKPAPHWAFPMSMADTNGSGNPELLYFTSIRTNPALDLELKQKYANEPSVASLSMETFSPVVLDGNLTYTGVFSAVEFTSNINLPGNFSVPLIADIDGDSEVEMITSGIRVRAWEKDGSLSHNFDKQGCPPVGTWPYQILVDDINANGITDIIASGCKQVIVWELVNSPLGKIEWGQLQHDESNSANYKIPPLPSGAASNNPLNKYADGLLQLHNVNVVPFQQIYNVTLSLIDDINLIFQLSAAELSATQNSVVSKATFQGNQLSITELLVDNLYYTAVLELVVDADPPQFKVISAELN